MYGGRTPLWRYHYGMKTLLLLVFLLPFGARASAPEPSEAVANERLYLRFQKEFSRKQPRRLRPSRMSARLQRLALDAAEDLLAAGLPLKLDSLIAPKDLGALVPKERARWHRLRGGGEQEEAALLTQLRSAEPEESLLYEMLRQKPSMKSEGLLALTREHEAKLPEEAARWKALTGKTRAFTPPTAAEVAALWDETHRIPAFQGGAYGGKPRLYMFCRHDRKQKCLLAMRDKDNQPVRNTDGSLWTQPALGLSARGLPFNERNGYTPQGVHLMRGVMPEANFPEAYGRFRRVILDFVPRSAGEAEQRKLLPEESQGRDWWKEAMIARDIGRGELRIHGTGERNDDTKTPYYTFVPTIGCVAQRELRYGNVTYTDQRLLLDRLMRAGGLSVGYASEPLIQGLFYVIELSAGGGAVTTAELARFGVQ